jgi:serine/threonine protein phosphatase PrpC
MLSVVTLSHPGTSRPTNEDAVLWDPRLGLLAIADGMGGHNAGEVASSLALDVLQQSLLAKRVKNDAEWPFGFVDELPLEVNRLRTAMRIANRDIFRASQTSAEYAGMGTTVTAALIDEAHVWFASVGDSRLYTKRAGEAPLRQLTRDDSFVGLLADSPGVAPAALAGHPMRHLLTSVLGPRADLAVDVEDIVLSDGELLLLTTDGMHGAVGDEVMDALLDGHEHGTDLHTAAEHFIEAALGAGGLDNITLALARYRA